MGRIKAFTEISSYDYRASIYERIKREIHGRSKEYILGVEEEEYINYITSQFFLEPIDIDYDSESFGIPVSSKKWVEDRMFREKYEVDVYTFLIKYNYTGSQDLFAIRPATFTMRSEYIYVERSTVSFELKINKQDPVLFNSEKQTMRNAAFCNVDNANAFVSAFNNDVSSVVRDVFNTQKRKYGKENDFFAAINLKVNDNTGYLFSAPVVKKKPIPQPTVAKSKVFAAEPTVAADVYDDILKLIYSAGKNMERKPSLYLGKDEEGLRDLFLYLLESRYEGVTATGETFNRGGKTDIILKHANDGTNLFVAECKFWHGAGEFHKAISQLFDRYLTWRDSKVALIFFVTNKEFSGVLETIKRESANHPYFSQVAGSRGESSFSYLFHLPQDAEKKVFLEVIAFHYDK